MTSSRRQTGQDARAVVPWVVSVGVHAGLIGLGFLVTWSVISLTDDEQPVVVQAQIDALTYDPLVRLDAPAETRDPIEKPARVPDEPLTEQLAQRLAEIDFRPPTIEAEAAPALGPAQPAAPGESASFVGMTASNARTVVFVIDASGSMIGTLPIVIGQLARSLRTLSPRQAYAVLFFQRNSAIAVPPGRLQQAGPAAVQRTLDWIDRNVTPAGRSNPIEALTRAVRLEPDVIFLLSEDVTGSGEFEIDQRDLLALLDRLNPEDRRTGARRTRINCVQFLEPDPLDTLGEIARRHGGRDGYRFLSAEELGIDPY